MFYVLDIGWKLIALAISLGLIIGCSPSSSISGDGALIEYDSIWWPRYLLEFPPIEMKDDARYEFEFAGAPNAHMLFELLWPGYTIEESASLRDRQITLSAVLRTSLGEVVLNLRDTLTEPYNYWTKEENKYFYLSYMDNWTDLKSEVHYVLELTVEVEGTSSHGSEPIVLIPRFRGGGKYTM